MPHFLTRARGRNLNVRKRTGHLEKIVTRFEGWREIAVRIDVALTIGRDELSNLLLRRLRDGRSSGRIVHKWFGEKAVRLYGRASNPRSCMHDRDDTTTSNSVRMQRGSR